MAHLLLGPLSKVKPKIVDYSTPTFYPTIFYTQPARAMMAGRGSSSAPKNAYSPAVTLSRNTRFPRIANAQKQFYIIFSAIREFKKIIIIKLFLVSANRILLIWWTNTMSNAPTRTLMI